MLAQLGIVLLVAAVWATILRQKVTLFSYHPLLNSVGILLIVEAIIILQPTHTPSQKRNGTLVHASLIGIGISALIIAFVIIEYNKFSHHGLHFKSSHGILGFITYILFILQTIVGFTQYFTPSLYGSVSKAKAVYKYHRWSGYLILILTLTTVILATRTTFNVNVLHLKLWVVVTTSALILVGIIPRIKLNKLGIKYGPAAH